VVVAIHNKATNATAGGDMPHLIETPPPLKSTPFPTQLLTNPQPHHQFPQTTLPKLLPPANSTPIPAHFTVDTANSDAAIVGNGVITVRNGMGGCLPDFGREQLIAGENCQVEIGDTALCFSLATADLRNGVGVRSLCVFERYGTVCSDELEQETSNSTPLFLGTQIEWMRGGHRSGVASIHRQRSGGPVVPGNGEEEKANGGW
jgi:hypothetical protein